MATFVDVARTQGVAGFVGDGANRWPAVHRSDAARLARLAVEMAPAGSVLHAVGDEGVPFRAIAEAMGRHLGVPTASVAQEHALAHFGPLGFFAGVDSPASAAITRELLGWEPTGPTLLEDLDLDHYYREVYVRGA
jgi:nucleoside-diphosphate-sugar epimerase